MPTENYTSKFRVDVSDLKKGLADANAAVKKANAEFKNATAGTKEWQKSADGLNAAITAQKKVVEEEQKKLDILKEQLDRLNKSQEDGKKIISDLNAKYDEAAKKYGATSEEAQKYAKQLSDAQKAQERNQKAAQDLETRILKQDTAIKEAKAGVNNYQTALTKLQQEGKSLTSILEKQEKELQYLKNRYADVAVSEGKNSTEAQRLAKEISTLSAEVKINKERLEESSRAADNFDKSLEDVHEQAQTTTDGGLNAFTVALGNLAANVITAVIDKLGQLGKAALDSFEDFDKGSDAIIKATGATGEAADEMRKAYANTAKGVTGDLEEIGAATGEVNTRLGFTGDKLTEATTAFVKFADITGGDATTAVRNVSRAIESAGLEADDYTILLDQLAIAAQASGISADTLAERLTTYGAQMRSAGYDTADTIAMLASWEKEGVNTETAITGLRKALANFGKEGSDASVELSGLIEQIKNAPTDAEAASLALEAFGNKAGTELVDDIRSGRFEFDAFTETIKNSAGTVEKTYEETQSGIDKIKLAAQSLRVTIGEAAGNILDTIAPNLEEVISMFESVVSGEEGAAEKLGEGVGNLLTNIVSKISEFVPTVVQVGISLVKSLITGILEALPDAVKTLGDSITAIINSLSSLNIADKILDVLPDLADALYSALPQILESVVNLVTALVDALPDIIDKALKTAPKVWDSITKSLQNGLPKIIEAVKKLISSLTIALPKILETLTKELPNIIKGFISTISTVYPLLLDAVIQMVQALVDAMPELIKIWNEAAPDLVKAIGQALIDSFPVFWSAGKQVWSLLLGAIPPLLESLWKFVYTSITTAVSSWGEILSPAANWIDQHVFRPIMAFFEPVIEFFDNGFKVINELAEGCWNLIKATWSVVSVWFNQNVFHPIMSFFEPVIEFFDKGFELIRENAEGCWELIKVTWSVVSTWFDTNVIGPVKSLFSDMWDKLKEGAYFAWDGIKSVFSTVADFFEDTFGGAWERVKNVFSTGGKVFDGIKDGIVSAFTSTVNALIRGINRVVTVPFENLNSVLDTLQNIEVLGMRPFDGLVTRIDVPQIPELEYGGILKRGQYGFLEGKNDEAVIPLQNNTEGLRRIAGLLSTEMGSGKPSGDTINNYNFTQTNNSPKPLSRWDIYRQTQNLLNALQGV